MLSRLVPMILVAGLFLTACQASTPVPTPVATATTVPEAAEPTAVPVVEPTTEAAEESTVVPTEDPESEMTGEEGPAFLTPLGTYNTGVIGVSATEIVAYDAGTQRIFSTSAFSNTLDILDAHDPANPTLIQSIDMGPYADGGINSVAVKDGLVVAAVAATDKNVNGQLIFLNAEGTILVAVEAGSLPDMVTFTPDGTKVVAANEGEPSGDYIIDPEGSITIVDLTGGVESLNQDAVTIVDFTAFNDAEIDPAIRIYGPNATVAQDLEPEYVAISSDSSTAFVTLQENNALAVVDLAAGEVTAVLALGFKDHNASGATLHTYTFEDLPVLGETPAGQEILLGGFSGLYFDGIDETSGNYQFITHPDRGPNGEPIDVNGDGVAERPFVLPEFQTRWISFELNPQTGELTITGETLLTRADGTPITGVSNLQGEDGMAYADEEPIDLLGNPLAYDAYGGDFEGIVRADDGTIWMVDEYRPAIYHFTPEGVLIDRFVPEGSSANVDAGKETLPAVYAQRRANRGFEAVAYDEGTLYAFIQSPIDNPDVADDGSSKVSVLNRILALDTATGQSVGEYLYVIDGGAVDKIGDAVALGDGQFLVIERDSAVGPDSMKYIYKIDLAGATNLQELDAALSGPEGDLEQMTVEQLIEMGIQPVQKDLYIDLAAIGYYQGDKAEGLALIDENTIAVINDNDFRLIGTFDPATGALDENPNAVPEILGIIDVSGSSGIDASDRDGAINIRNWPVLGMYQPDAIAAYEVDGETYLVTANEGDARDYDAYSEETRVADIVLDPEAFPNAEELQADENLGRLRTTTATGDIDGDGDFDQIYSYGARSFSIWTSAGELVWDSGDQIEQITAAMYPDYFNSQAEAEFDARSDDKGPEPEALTLGTISGHTYAFVGLERISGIMVFDITDPMAPTFVDYVNNRDFSGDPEAGTAGDNSPEGIVFIEAEDSPTGAPLLIVANEYSGTVTIYSVNP